MNAASRDEVFKALREKGIKAIKVVAADGSKANGEVRGVRKRVVAALVIGVSLLVGGAVFFSLQSTNSSLLTPNSSLIHSPRHQIYGDPAIVGGLERGELAEILPRLGDQLLAIFAQPGKFMCPHGFDPRRLNPKDGAALAEYASTELAAERDLEINPEDSREVCELKQIVNGIRQELREYLANGNGTPRSFWRRLNERTVPDLQICLWDTGSQSFPPRFLIENTLVEKNCGKLCSFIELT